MDGRRVVISGMGAVSCVGVNVGSFWDSIVNGRCGLDKITKFDAAAYRTQIGGEVRDLNIASYMPEKEARHLDDFCHYAIAAADEAIKDAGLTVQLDQTPGIDPERVGVCIGSGIGGMRTMEEQCRQLIERGPGRTSPFLIPMMIIDMASGSVSIRTGAKGPNIAAVSACATATHSLGESFWMIKRGDADMMISGGAEAAISRLGFAGFCSMKAMSQRNDDPKHASRPFDSDRDGFVMSDGAGVLILEELEHAQKRGAKIYAEVVGYGATGDAYHFTSPAPGGEGGARAFKAALRVASLPADAVDYINAHGTSTSLNDKFETAAIKTVFGARAGKEMSMSSTKGTMGHSLGAAGALETIICVKAIQTGIVPPTINYQTPDPECDIDCTPNTARERKIDVALNTNLGFGGHNGTIILRRFS